MCLPCLVDHLHPLINFIVLEIFSELELLKAEDVEKFFVEVTGIEDDQKDEDEGEKESWGVSEERDNIHCTHNIREGSSFYPEHF